MARFMRAIHDFLLSALCAGACLGPRKRGPVGVPASLLTQRRRGAERPDLI